MDQNLHFISGLPRAGTTLLSAILKQNPAFHARMSGPTGAIFEAMQGAVSTENEFARFMTDKQKENHLRAVFDAHYSGLKGVTTVFDTHRVWAAKTPVLKTLFPKSYIFCCVRNLAWIMDSMERLINGNVLELSRIFNLERTNTVYSRLDGLSSQKGLVGFAYNAVRGAFFGAHSERLVLIRYETLSANPKLILDNIYKLIGEKPFQHKFDGIEYSEEEYDSWLGTPGLHTIRPRVAAETRETVLPPDLFARYENEDFWNEPVANLNKVTIW